MLPSGEQEPAEKAATRADGLTERPRGYLGAAGGTAAVLILAMRQGGLTLLTTLAQTREKKSRKKKAK